MYVLMLKSIVCSMSDFRCRIRKFKSQLSHMTLMKIGCEIISMVIHSRMAVVSFCQIYVQDSICINKALCEDLHMD